MVLKATAWDRNSLFERQLLCIYQPVSTRLSLRICGRGDRSLRFLQGLRFSYF